MCLSINVIITDCARQQLAESGVIPRLVHLLNDENKELSLQCVRALGNLCYEQGKL